MFTAMDLIFLSAQYSCVEALTYNMTVIGDGVYKQLIKINWSLRVRPQSDTSATH